MPGIEHCITSDGFFALQQQPESVAVVGGGYIGVELAGVFQALGTRTSLLTRADKPLKGFDDLLVRWCTSQCVHLAVFVPRSVVCVLWCVGV